MKIFKQKKTAPLLWSIFAYYRVIKQWLTRPHRLNIYNFLFHPTSLRKEKNTNEQRVITDYMQDISKFCRLWLSKTYNNNLIYSFK
jgi:hypothetical protein